MVFLASTSSRRKVLLTQLIGNQFKIVKSNYKENNYLNLSPKKLVIHHAYQKAITVAKNLDKGIVIGADTIVVLNGKIFGKPKSKEEAKKVLTSFSGQTLQVMTGLSVIDITSNKFINICETSEVFMDNFSEKTIEYYIGTGEPLDKAGAFAIQGLGAILVKSIKGDYFNIVGLPIHQLYKIFKKMGVNALGNKV